MRKLSIAVLIVIGFLVLLVVVAVVFKDALVRKAFEPNQEVSEPDLVPVDQEVGSNASDQTQLFEVVATDLEVPWDIEFLPNGDLLVTERPGRLTRIDASEEKHSVDVPAVKHTGEGGLLGLALHPDFSNSRWLYIYITGDSIGSEQGSGTVNRVLRYVYENDTLRDEKIIVDNIPGAIFHDGGQLAFGQDGYLYITTGDSRNPDLSQNKGSLAGKILRVTDDGNPALGNPFMLNFRDAVYVYSYGHRNPQGLAWDREGRLWSTEHGPSSPLPSDCCRDELNLIEAGKNYGWPVIKGNERVAGMETPVLQSGNDTTWAPASLAYLNNKLFWGGLRGETLYEYNIQTSELKKHFFIQFGRIRAVVVGPDNMLYITTSNRDGRGDVRTGDDKLIRVNPELLERN